MQMSPETENSQFKDHLINYQIDLFKDVGQRKYINFISIKQRLAKYLCTY